MKRVTHQQLDGQICVTVTLPDGRVLRVVGPDAEFSPSYEMDKCIWQETQHARARKLAKK